MDSRSGREIASDETVQLAVKLINIIVGGGEEKLDVVSAFDPEQASDVLLTAIALMKDVDRSGLSANLALRLAAEQEGAKLHCILRMFRDLSPEGPSLLEELGVLFQAPESDNRNH